MDGNYMAMLGLSIYTIYMQDPNSILHQFAPADWSTPGAPAWDIECLG